MRRRKGRLARLGGWLDDRLVDGWRKAHRWLSVQVSGLILVAEIGYQNSDALQTVLPAEWFRYAMAGLAGIVLIGRLFRQKHG